ncbi:hypothetical protein [Bacilliculturomica massiliensis]|uniref:hypothetical protein n=1 Tax=Bacilliculturomica massiliensis TaxID=1917867 RepID=UPI00102F6C92|nr:hypothetical protein [Bacilliculturomica massiliensis]
MMNSKNGFHCCCNVQTAVDAKTHLIAAFEVTNHANDQQVLSAFSQKVKQDQRGSKKPRRKRGLVFLLFSAASAAMEKRTAGSEASRRRSRCLQYEESHQYEGGSGPCGGNEGDLTSHFSVFLPISLVST